MATVKRVGRDKLRVRLSGEEIALLRSLPDQLRSVLVGAGNPDAMTERFGGLPPDADDPSTVLDPWAPRSGPPAAEVDPRFGPPAGPGGGPAGPGGAEDGPDEASQRPAAPVDPVLERLFPRAYLEPEDVERDAEYRRLVRNDLLESKLANLDVITKTLDRGTVSLRRWTVDLSEEEAGAWLGALNDLRLALGVRLGITEDFEGDVDPSDPQAPALHVLSYLGWLEENLLEALTSG
ncbi:MAG TPA: DUF2017 family protein [Actinomycetes bacterium]